MLIVFYVASVADNRPDGADLMHVSDIESDSTIVTTDSGLSSRPYVAINTPTYDLTDFEDLKSMFNEDTVDPLRVLRQKVHQRDPDLELTGSQWQTLDEIIWAVSITEMTFATPTFDLDLEELQRQIYCLNQQLMTFQLKTLHRHQQLLLLQSR